MVEKEYPKPTFSISGELLNIDFYPSEPTVFRIIKSGWPDMYHLIQEDGAYSFIEHDLLHINDLEKKFPITFKDSKEWIKFKNES